jgi:hypothetical protein
MENGATMRAWRVLLAVAAALLLAAALSRGPVRAQQPAERDVHFGAGSCAAQACHGGGTAAREEYKVWATRDRHSKAYDVLSGELGRRIGERLRLDPPNAPQCLSCHGTTGAPTAATFDPHDGVSCEHCHGAAGRWLGPHAAPGFAERPVAEKERLGLVDLSTPAKRAALCVTCHVGGPGRDLTHEIMAAGHPPLAFDLAKFVSDLPPHWKNEGPPGPAAWAEGIKATVAARLRQVARAADALGEWPEFGAFDCYSCHHVIGPGMDARPGARPGDLPLDLAALDVLALAAGDKALDRALEGIRGATYRPGADRRDLAEFAARAARDVEAILPAASGFGPEDAERFARNLDEHLAQVEAGEARATYASMVGIAFAVFDLAPGRAAPAFRDAYAALDEALARPFDARACATLARRALAAR